MLENPQKQRTEKNLGCSCHCPTVLPIPFSLSLSCPNFSLFLQTEFICFCISGKQTTSPFSFLGLLKILPLPFYLLNLVHLHLVTSVLSPLGTQLNAAMFNYPSSLFALSFCSLSKESWKVSSLYETFEVVFIIMIFLFPKQMKFSTGVLFVS